MNKFAAFSYATICLVFLVTGSGCKHHDSLPLKIALSKASPNYINWIKKCDSSAVIVNMYGLPPDSAVKELEKCAGLILTGGEDVQPSIYGKEENIVLCTETNPARDTLELALIKKALELKMPVLGICRGEQILNVALGGTLIADIPEWSGEIKKATGHGPQACDIQPGARSPKPEARSVTHQMDDYLRCFHKVEVVKKTLLASITGADTATVTSNHHQAVENLAEALVCNATADDGIVEGIEWKDPSGKSFLLGVQWHPERMDTSNLLSGRLCREFLNQTKIFSTARSKTEK